VADRIVRRVARVKLGNFGDFRSVGEDVQELRIQIGPGIRVYFGRQSETIVVLLWGGDKQSQRSDIRRAQLYWKDYRSRTDV
jgi:putative addiction module killer protein